MRALLWLCFVSGCIAMTIDRRVDDVLSQVNDVVLAATQSMAMKAPTSEILNTLQPIVVLVDSMMDQLHSDTAFHITEESQLRKDEENALNERRTVVANMGVGVMELEANLNLLIFQKDQAKNISDSSALMLAEVASSLQKHQETCMRRVPELVLRLEHTQRDERLLVALKAKLDEIAKAGKSGQDSTAAHIAMMLPQIHHSLRIFQTGAQALNQIDTPTTGNNGTNSTDVETMRALLASLNSELQTVLSATENEINAINNTCRFEEDKLLDAESRLANTLDLNQAKVAARTIEIAAIQRSLEKATQALVQGKADLQSAEHDAATRMRVYLALMKSRMHTMVTLSEMHRLLNELIARLSTMLVPDLTRASSKLHTVLVASR